MASSPISLGLKWIGTLSRPPQHLRTFTSLINDDNKTERGNSAAILLLRLDKDRFKTQLTQSGELLLDKQKTLLREYGSDDATWKPSVVITSCYDTNEHRSSSWRWNGTNFKQKKEESENSWKQQTKRRISWHFSLSYCFRLLLQFKAKYSSLDKCSFS